MGKQNKNKPYPVEGCNYYCGGDCSLTRKKCDQIEHGWRGCPHRSGIGQALINARRNIPEDKRTPIVPSAATLRAHGEVPPKRPSRHR